MKDIPLKDKLAICKDDNGIMRILYGETEVKPDSPAIACYDSHSKSVWLFVGLSRKTINAVLDLIHEHDHKALY